MPITVAYKYRRFLENLATDVEYCRVRNQCDGCIMKMPIEDFIHRYPDGRPYMCCTAHQYEQQQ